MGSIRGEGCAYNGDSRGEPASLAALFECDFDHVYGLASDWSNEEHGRCVYYDRPGSDICLISVRR